jgi:aspartate carbamoyltransferase catalytic subunit
VSLCAPYVYLPEDVNDLGITIIEHMDEAIKTNDALILLRVQHERDAGKLLNSIDEYKQLYGMNEKRLALNPDIKILHPGPWNEGVELDQFIIDSPNFYGYKQVTNGLAVRLAVLKLLNISN